MAGGLLQLLHQHVEPRPPLRPHLGRAGSNTASARSRPITRWSEAPKLNSSALPRVARFDLHLVRRAEAARQRAIVQLEDEVAAAAFARNDGA